MPPLRHWFIGFGCAGVSAIVGHQYVYLPRLEAQEQFESLWEMERRASQAVWQKLALLEQASRKMESRRKSAPFSISTDEQLKLYGELQEARSSLLDVLTSRNTSIARSINHAQAVDFLRRLDAIEAAHCKKLTFRKTALSWKERTKCFACFCIYFFYFKMLPFLFPSENIWSPQFYHALSRRIMAFLDIPYSMEVGPKWAEELLEERCNESLALSSSPSPKELASTSHGVKVILPTQHWIEEVGFWACENNPLLLVSSFTASSPKPAEMKLCTGPSVPYDMWWREQFDPFPAIRQYMISVRKPWRMGYPLVPSIQGARESVVEDGSGNSITMVPVAVSGLPGICDAELNEMNEDLISIKPKRAYDYVVEQQFIRNQSDNGNYSSTVDTSNSPTEQKVELEEEEVTFLQYAFKYGVSVHGDASTARYKEVAPPSLRFHVGKICFDEQSLMRELVRSWKLAVGSS